jgi:hypothetical protein
MARALGQYETGAGAGKPKSSFLGDAFPSIKEKFFLFSREILHARAAYLARSTHMTRRWG